MVKNAKNETIKKEDWNEAAFINANKGTENVFKNLKIFEHDNKWFKDKYEQPIFSEEQKKKHLENIENFETWLIETVKK